MQSPTRKQPIYQTSIGLGSMVMMESPKRGAKQPPSSNPMTPTKTHYQEIDEEEDHSPQRQNFHRRNTIVRANGRKRCPEPPLCEKTCTLRRGEIDEDEDDVPLTPPTRTKSVAPRASPRLVEF